MATAANVLSIPQDTPTLNEFSEFPKWKRAVGIYVNSSKHMNKHCSESSVAAFIFPRLLEKVTVNGILTESIFDEWNDLFEKLIDVKGNGDPSELSSMKETFIKFILKKMGLPYLKYVKNQVNEWCNSDKSRGTIYEEAVFYLSIGTDPSLIIEGLERCDPRLLNEVTVGMKDFDALAIVEKMKERDIFLSSLDGVSRLNLPFKSSVHRIKKSSYRKNIRNKFMKSVCYNCGRKGHLTKFCKAPKNSNKRVSSNYIGKFLYADVDINGQRIRGLLDTGACESFIRMQFLNKEQITWKCKEFRSANNQSFKSIGTVDAVVKFKNMDYPHRFHVVKDLSENAIIGIDFLSKNGISLEFKEISTASINSITHMDVQKKYSDIIVDELDKNSGMAKVDPIKLRVHEGCQPIYQRNYRKSETEWLVIQNEIDKMIKNGVIEVVDPTLTEKSWNSPILLIRKPDNTWRFCIDFRNLNKVTIKEACQLPCVEEILDLISGSKYFSKFDLASGYWQFPVSEESRKFLRFETRDTQYQFKVMPFGITNAPAVFQRTMQSILKKISGCIVLIDDIIVFSDTEQENLRICEEVLERLKEYNLKIKKKKCVWLTREINIFGYVIKEGSLTIDPERAQAIEKIGLPTTLREMQSFLGSTNYYRRLIKDYAGMETKIRSAIDRDGKINWNHTAIEAFTLLKKKLMELPQTYNFSPGRKTILQCDASGDSIGSVLLQVIDNKEVPIYFYSRQLTKIEKRYPITEKELLAVYASIIKLRHFLYGHKFVIKTDHKPLVSILKSPDSKFNVNWARRLLKICEMEFEVEYIKGKDNLMADLLSRINYINVKVPDMKEGQELDRDVQYFVKKDKRVIFKNDIAYLKINNRGELLLLPKIYHYEVLLTAHGNENGHFGVRKTIERVLEHFFWKNVYNDVREFVMKCEHCLKNKQQGKNIEYPMHLEKRNVWTDLAMDIIGPIGRDKYILTIIDMFSKYLISIPLQSLTSGSIIHNLSIVFNKNGVPETVITDNGPQFTSKEIESWFKDKGIMHKKTSIYNPQSNGVIERANKTLKDGIRILINQGWKLEEAIKHTTNNYNHIIHDSTGYPPSMLMFGEKINIFQKLRFLEGVELNKSEITKDKIIRNAKNNLEMKERKRDDIINNKLKGKHIKKFREGEMVYIQNVYKRSKMEPFYIGPKKILRQVNEFSYLVEGFSRPFNVRKLIKAGINREASKGREEISKENINDSIIKFDTLVLDDSPSREPLLESASDEEYTSADEEMEIEDYVPDSTLKLKEELITKLKAFESGKLKKTEFKDIIDVYIRSGRSILTKMINEKRVEDIYKWITSSSDENFKKVEE